MIRGEHITWGMSFKIKWGKYKDKLIREVAQEDLGYLKWLYIQSPNKFALDAAVAVQILCFPGLIDNEALSRSDERKVCSAIARLFCRSLAASDEPFDESVENTLNELKDKYYVRIPDSFVEYLSKEEAGKVIVQVARQELFKLRDTTMLASTTGPDEMRKLLDLLIKENKDRIAGIKERERISKANEEYYASANIAYGDW